MVSVCTRATTGAVIDVIDDGQADECVPTRAIGTV
jgi:hypothetical protein